VVVSVSADFVAAEFDGHPGTKLVPTAFLNGQVPRPGDSVVLSWIERRGYVDLDLRKR
jgi:hypothetical protein